MTTNKPTYTAQKDTQIVQTLSVSYDHDEARRINPFASISIDTPGSPWKSDGTDIASFRIELEDNCSKVVRFASNVLEGPSESDNWGDLRAG